MRDISRAVALLLVCYPLLLLTQNPAGQLPTPDQNSILNLYDAFGYQKRGTILDWGFSAFVRYNGKTILFDTGNSADGFEHNVKALGVDLKEVDIAVLSHRHYDHISGFDYMLKVKPQVKAYLPADEALGAPFRFTFSKDTKESHRFLCDSYLTRTALRFGRCLLSSHVLLRSRFAHALRSLVSQRKRRAAAHNRVVSGTENPHSRSTVNQALGGAVATGVLGNPAIALCAVPLLIPVSALICAHERP